MGLSDAMIPKLVEAADSAERPPVVWNDIRSPEGLISSIFTGNKFKADKAS
ncbi:MAG: hypothetical protein ABFS19_04150 [Thermodesulfobacteriota bacterium]